GLSFLCRQETRVSVYVFLKDTGFPIKASGMTKNKRLWITNPHDKLVGVVMKRKISFVLPASTR
ncbi:MAG: hypothetical protein AABZ23_07135, partial [Deltaproteobacteria bacterium]